jgi:DNA-directed RNA polymerase specialized sigma24 family protein
MRPREIGHALGLNEHTVRSRLVRGRAALRERVVLH